MVYKTRGNTTKLKIGQLLDFFSKNKSNKYCSHEIARIYGIPNRDASTNLSVLQHWNYITVVTKDKCAECKMRHSFYRYKKGDKDAVLGRRFLTHKKNKGKKYKDKKKYKKKVVSVNNQTEKIITIPVTVRFRVNLE